MRNIGKSLRAALVIAACVAGACKSSTGPSDKPDDGAWTGTTAAGDAISFTVQGSSILNLVVRVRVSGSCSVSAIEHRSVAAITIANNNAFSFGSASDGVTGSFSSSTAASGSATAAVNVGAGGQSCSSSGQTSWTARR
jgi:hypothetical protein